MPVQGGDFVNWGYDDQMPHAWSQNPANWGLTGETWFPVVCNFSRGKAYRLYFAEITFDINFVPITPINVFGITKYDIPTKDATSYFNLASYFGSAFKTNGDSLKGFWLLPKSFEGTGSDLLLVHHTLEATAGGNPLELRATLINMDSGTVLFSTVVPTYTALGGSDSNDSPFFEHVMVCNIGTAPNNWYVIARNNNAAPNGGLDWFSVYEITSNGSTGSLTQRLAMATISSGVGQTMTSLNTWQALSDGVSYWTAHDTTNDPIVDYIKWNWPWPGASVTLGVLTLSVDIRHEGQMAHALAGINYLIVSRWNTVTDARYLEAFTYVTPTGTYTKIWEQIIDPAEISITAKIVTENTLFGNFGTDLTNSYEKGSDSFLVILQMSDPANDLLWAVCIIDGTLSDCNAVRADAFGSIAAGIMGDLYLADPGGAASFDSREIKSKLVDFSDVCLVPGGIDQLGCFEVHLANFTEPGAIGNQDITWVP